MIPVEWGSYEILAALARDARSYLCVGVQEGDCLERVVRANPGIERLALCDTWGSVHGGTGRGNHDHIAKRLESLGYRGAVKYLDGRSDELVPTLTESFDLSYVDGDHSEEAALCDLGNIWPRTTWAMVVHDIRMASVWSAFTRFFDVVRGATLICAMGGHGTAVAYRVLA